MAKRNGRTVLMYIHGTPDVLIGSQRDVTIDEQRTSVDVSDKASQNKRILAGEYSGKVTITAAYDSADSGQTTLRSDLRAGTAVVLAYYEDGSAVVTCSAQITKFSVANPNNQVSLVTIEAELDGQWA